MTMTAITVYVWFTAGMFILSIFTQLHEPRTRDNKIALCLSVVMSIFGIVCVNLLDRI